MVEMHFLNAYNQQKVRHAAGNMSHDTTELRHVIRSVVKRFALAFYIKQKRIDVTEPDATHKRLVSSDGANFTQNPGVSVISPDVCIDTRKQQSIIKQIYMFYL